MGCTQAQNVNRIQIAPLGQDPESLKQFYRLQHEQHELQQQFQGDAAATKGAPRTYASAEKTIVRQDWARLKQTLAPKNSIQLINCRALQPLLAKAVGNDNELKAKVIRLFLKQTKAPKSQIHSRLKEGGSSLAGDDTHNSKVGPSSQNGASGKETDEVDYCVKIAQEQLPLFRKKSRIAELYCQLAKTFGDILKANPQLKPRAARSESQRDQEGSLTPNTATAASALPIPWNDNWYNRYSYVLLSELASFAPIYELIISKGNSFIEKTQNSAETVYFYGCAMVAIRFLEGTSWGYSEMLMHQKLDSETLIALRVAFNLLLRLKQSFREDKQIGPAFNKDEDVGAVYFPEPIFQRIYSHNQLDKLICMQGRADLETLGDLGDQESSSFQYFDNQIFRKTYIAAKKEIDDWLRTPSYMKIGKQPKGGASDEQAKHHADRDETEFLTQLKESSIRQQESSTGAARVDDCQLQLSSDVISVALYKQRQSVKTLTRDFITQLKNPDLKLDGSLKPVSARKTSHHARNLATLHYDQNQPFVAAQAQISKSAPEQKVIQGADDGKPNFEIDNSRNVLLLLGAATDTRVIVESFLQANVRMRSKYKCTVLHSCTRENKITHDAYYIVKHIIMSIVRTVPAVRKLLMLQKHDIFRELLTSKAALNKELKLQQEAPSLLVKFMKILQQLKLDFNICVFITGLENVFDKDDLLNIVYVLRSLTCNSLYMPLYMRFVLTAEKRESKSSNFELLVKLLQTKKIVYIHDHKFFESEGYSLVDFVFQYTQTLAAQNRLQKADISGTDLDQATQEQRSRIVSEILTRSQLSYRVIVDILSKVDLSGVYLIQVERAIGFLEGFQSDHIKFLPKLQAVVDHAGNDRLLTRTILQVLIQICGPLSFSLFARICHCLLVAKIYVKAQAGRDDDEVDQLNSIHGMDGTKPANTRNDANEKLAAGKGAHLTTMLEVSKENSEQANDLRQSVEQQLNQNADNRRTSSDQRASNALGGKTQELPQTSSLQLQSQDEKPDAIIEHDEEVKLTPQMIDTSGGAVPLDISPNKEFKNGESPAKEEQQLDNTEADREYASPPQPQNSEATLKLQEGAGQDGGAGGPTSAKRVDIMLVVKHVMEEANIDYPLEKSFVDVLTKKLLSISEFMHFVSKERISLHRKQSLAGQSFNDEISSSCSEDEDEAAVGQSAQHSQEQAFLAKLKSENNALDILRYAQTLQEAGSAQQGDRLQSEVLSKLMIVARKRKMIKACMSVLNLGKSRYFDAVVQLIALEEFGGKNPLNKTVGHSWRQAAPYETIDPYLRLYIYHHWSKSLAKLRFNDFETLLTIENIFKQIVYFGSYDRLRKNLRLIFKRPGVEDTETQGITYLLNTLHLVQQTLKYEPINYLDFCTQMRGRTLGDAGARNLPDMKFTELLQNASGGGNSGSNVCFFENFHHSLRENPRIDLILQFAGCQILTLKFFSDKKRVMISLSNGLLVQYNTETNRVLKVYPQSHAVIDKVKIIDDRYIICAGIDPKHRIWNVENQRQVSKFEMHGYCTSQIVIYKEFLITYGYSRTLVKFNFMKKQYQCWQETASYLTNLKLLKTNDKTHPVKLIASFTDGDIVLYSVDLSVLCHINRSVQEPVLRIICLSLSESLCFYRDGQISVMSGIILEETKAGSIFSLKSDDYIDMILIKSREYFLFTIEKQKIEFFNASTFKRSDSWDYFFERDIVGCDKNKEGSKICVWDKGGYLTLFNFLKHLDNTQKQFNTPSHRRYDPVVCIDVTERLGDKNQVISCSLERDLRVWSRDTGLFLKKYDLSSFTAENVSTIRLGKSEGMLFLGSKDMNVYLIDVARGKLCVVYEGHWSRVTSIYTLPGKDILVTLSESNIKVWDLEYDECIKNMNDHSSLIVYCALSHDDDQRIVTISQSLEYKEWSYVTGDIVKQFSIDLSSVRDGRGAEGDDEFTSSSEGDSEDDSDSDDSQNDLNPQGDDDQRQSRREQRRQVRQNERQKSKAKHTERKPKNLIACHVSASGMAYLAIDCNKIIVYNLSEKEVQSVFESYQCQTVIYLSSIETARNDYLIVVTRTSCVLYALFEDGVRRMTSYLINSRKRPYRSLEENRFSYSVRFYFTSAKIIKAQEEEHGATPAANGSTDARQTAQPIAKKEARGYGLLGSDFSMAQAAADGAISESAFEYIQGGLRTPEMLVRDDLSANDALSLRQSIGGESSLQMLAHNHARTYKNAIESLSQSPLPEHRNLAVSLQRSQNMWNHNSQPGLIVQNQQSQLGGGVNCSSSENLHQLYDSGAAAAQSQPQLMLNPFAPHETQSIGLTDSRNKQGHREKYLVYLGDSRGQVHMTSLYLS